MNDSALRALIEDHLEKMRGIHLLELRGQATSELSYRPTIHEFLQKIAEVYAPEAEVISEPPSQRQRGHPDWLFHHRRSMGVYGYAEAKGFDPERIIDWKRHREQTCRYLSLGHKLMFTDGVDFFLFGPHLGEPKHIALAEKPLDARSEWRPATPAHAVRPFFSDFFREPAPKCVTDSGLVADLAVRAKNLTEDIKSLVRLRPDEGIDAAETRAITALRSIKETLQVEYDASLSSNERFSKAVSQILVFGAFYAHRHLYRLEKPADLRKQLVEFWTSEITTDSENRLKPFRALADILGKDSHSLGAINSPYYECMLYLSYVRLSKSQQERPNYHKLYETFLVQFDPRDRTDFGAYATPSNLARFMIGFAEHVSRSVFGRSVFMDDNKIIEPCCGTGTFLEEILKEAEARNVEARRFPPLAGNEIMAAPYALSQYRLYQLKEQYPLASRIRSLLCNTLQ
ncbi:MAG: SAM-dependent DNA methyltransferase [Nitrosopumilaceae archaeon]|nr:SAM-dependent DNA methyltransferase [Nitrosopumilaceae archaeon]